MSARLSLTDLSAEGQGRFRCWGEGDAFPGGRAGAFASGIDGALADPDDLPEGEVGVDEVAALAGFEELLARIFSGGVAGGGLDFVVVYDAGLAFFVGAIEFGG